MSGASTCTVTVSATAPTVISISDWDMPPTLMTTGLRTTVLKPSSCARSS